MILTIDLGNSNTVLVGYDEGDIVYEKRVITYKEKVTENYTAVFSAISESVEAVVVSCVVPLIEDEFIALVQHFFKVKAIKVNGSTIKDFKIIVADPKEVGSDLIATSIGASAKYDLPAIVADIGSATKVTYTDETGLFSGAIIIPGIGISLKAMTDYIPHLPKVDLQVPQDVLGVDSIGAIQSGLMYGVMGQVEGIADRIEEKKVIRCSRILTGGYAVLIKDHIKNFIYDPHLLNDGLYEIYKKGMYYEN